MHDLDTLNAHFDNVEDPRINRTKLHSIQEILFLILAAVICGVQSWCGVEEFGKDRIEWLRKYYPYENGIPSHDTLGRVMSLVKPTSIVKAYMQFMASLFQKPEGEIIALDGKTLRRSFDKASGQKPLHILNAWAVKAGLAIGQLAVDSKTNEITAVPELLDMIDVRHATITTDALNTQKSIAEKIINKGADYALPVKDNHKNLKEEIELAFDTSAYSREDSEGFLETTDHGHGRVEVGRYSSLPAGLIASGEEWPGLKAIGKAETEVFKGEVSTSETRYSILSFTDIQHFSESVRGHWGVENKLHWVLDVTFREDDSRVRTDHAPSNFSSIRKLALNLLRAEKTSGLSIPMKQAKASRRTEYLDKILECGKV
jgi:predicted transposase YbfD/YdcC